MKILAHRGFWHNEIEKNTLVAFDRALTSGFGLELDIRDFCGKLVISHNIPDENSPIAESILSKLSYYQNKSAFAINIKSDGLKNKLKKYIDEYVIKNYFLFDMSIPQMIEFAEMGLRYFTRRSEVEVIPVMYDKAAGVWIDGFWRTDWIKEDLLNQFIRDGKEVCLVSPELHKREYRKFWEFLKYLDVNFEQVMLCTDYPNEARDYFCDVLER